MISYTVNQNISLSLTQLLFHFTILKLHKIGGLSDSETLGLRLIFYLKEKRGFKVDTDRAELFKFQGGVVLVAPSARARVHSSVSRQGHLSTSWCQICQLENKNVLHIFLENYN